MVSLTAINAETGDTLLLESTTIEIIPPTTPTSHTALTNRATADQHPVGAITGLEPRLASNESNIATLQNDVADLGNIQNGLSNTIGNKADLPDPTISVCKNIDNTSSAVDMADFKINQNTSSISTLAINQGDMAGMPLGAGTSIAENVSALDSEKQNKTDNSLSTSSKNIASAINEVNSKLVNPDLEYVDTIFCGNSTAVEVPLSIDSSYKLYYHLVISQSGNNLDINFFKDNSYDTTSKYEYVINRWSSSNSSSVISHSSADSKIKFNAQPLPSGVVEFEVDLMNANALNYPILKAQGMIFDSSSSSIAGNQLFGVYKGTRASKIKVTSSVPFNNLNNVNSRVVVYKYRG